MEAAEAQRAVQAAISTASALDLEADHAAILSNSNRLVVHLTPCDVVARVAAPGSFTRATARASWLSGDGYQARLATEVELVQRLVEHGGPVAGLEPRVEPRVFRYDGFAISMWNYFEPVGSQVFPPGEYALGLERLHDGLRQVDVSTPHFTDRLGATQHDLASRDITPDLADTDRRLLVDILRDATRSILQRHAAEQILHGEPHPWNVLTAKSGPLFTDFEDAVSGPIEFDLAWVPQSVSDRYVDADHDLVGECRGVVLAIIATHRWSRNDQHPSGRPSGEAFLNALRKGPPWPSIEAV